MQILQISCCFIFFKINKQATDKDFKACIYFFFKFNIMQALQPSNNKDLQ